MKIGKYYKNKGVYQGKRNGSHVFITSRNSTYFEQALDWKSFKEFAKEHPENIAAIVLSIFSFLLALYAFFT